MALPFFGRNTSSTPLQVLAAVLFVSVTPLASTSSAFAQTPAAPNIPADMVLVPAGDFQLGTDSGDNPAPNQPRFMADAKPLQTARIAAFAIDRTEVTNAQYAAFCRATGYATPPHWRDGTFPNGEENFPVTHVNWFEAKAYARWAKKRLPTEMEWEKAARGNDGRTYPWGEGFDGERLVWNATRPSAVGLRPGGASPYGALDMAGNVYEWTSDWYRAYPKATFDFPEYGTQFKVIRGGSFQGYDFMARSYYRSVARQRTRSEWLGFRCAKTIDAK